MIYTECTVTIRNGNEEATIDRPIVLYRGDREVDIYFTIVDSPFKYKKGNPMNVIESTEASYAQLVIRRENAEPIFSEIKPTENGKALLTVSGSMIDELIEIGEYDFQIRLYSHDQASRITIPPIMAGIKIKEPIAINPEDEVPPAVINEGEVGASTLAADEVVDLELADGAYNRIEWKTGDLITAGRLNKLEEAMTVVYGIKPQSIYGNLNKGIASIVNAIKNTPSLDSRINVMINNAAHIELSNGETIIVNNLGERNEATIEFTQVPGGLVQRYRLKFTLSTDRDLILCSFTMTIGDEKAVLVDDILNRIESVDMTGMATETYVLERIEEIPEPDLSGYATKEELPSVDGLATEEYVNNAVSNIKYISSITIDTFPVLRQTFNNSGPYNLRNVNIHDDMSSVEVLDGVYYVTYRGNEIHFYDYVTTETLVYMQSRENRQLIGIKESIGATFATQSYVDVAISNIPVVDTSNFATKEELSTQIGDIESILKSINGEEI